MSLSSRAPQRGGAARREPAADAALPLLLDRCQRLIGSGAAIRAVDELRGVAGPARTRRVDLLEGDALRAAGRWEEAMRSYAALDPTAAGDGDGDGDEPLAPDLAWRVARIHLDQARLGRAVMVLQRAAPVRAVSGHRAVEASDQARLESTRAVVHWQCGSPDEAARHAWAGLDAASASADPAALAAAHVAVALALSLGGDPASVVEHYRIAARSAAEADDVLQVARIEANLSHHLLADARFGEALAAAEAAATALTRFRAAAQGAAGPGAVGLEAVAAENAAEALVRLGRYDEAVVCYERVLAMADRLGTRGTAGALLGLGEVHLRRASPEQQRAALQQAVRLCDDEECDRQVRVPAFAALGRAVAGEDLELARGLTGAALAEASGSGLLPALVGAAHVALAAQDADAVRQLSLRAVQHARQRRERSWLAQALELRAETEPAPRARSSLREAHAIWAQSGSAYDADRVLVRLGALAGCQPRDRMAARVAAVRLEAAGVPAPPGPRRVAIRCFGRFEVVVDGTPVPPEAWQSRRARDLLRVLVARRGRAVPRLELCEALWPDESADRLTHRLSTLLSLVRGVVGAALVTDRDTVALDTEAVRVDVEEFLTDVADAAELSRAEEPEPARLVLAEALRRHTDEPFADTPYDDLTVELREEARAACTHGLRLMARLCRAAGDHDEAAAWLRRLVAIEPFDEDAHRALVAVLTGAGRHGQARKAADRYRRAMAELGLPPAGRLVRAARPGAPSLDRRRDQAAV